LKFGPGFITERNQLQWVVLLAIAVVLPTVSLLWFMSKAVSNERLVIREKLAAIYQDKLALAGQKAAESCAANINAIGKTELAANPYSLFKQLVLERNFEGVVAFDSKSAIVYPVLGDIIADTTPQDTALAAASQLEFTDRRYAEAAESYGKFSADKDPPTVIAAVMGKSRCLNKLGRPDEAIEECQKAALTSVDGNRDTASLVAIQNARLLLLDLLRQTDTKSRQELVQRTVNALIADLYIAPKMPSSRNLFIAEKVLETIGEMPFLEDKITLPKGAIAKLVAAEGLSISVAENQSLIRTLAEKQPDTFFRAGDCYGLYHKKQSTGLLILFSNKGIASSLGGYEDTFKDSDSAYRIIDTSGDFVAGSAKPTGRPFATASLADCFPGWKIELYFKESGVFDKVADRQIAIYIWTGTLVILLILVIAAFAARAIGRQIRLNKMKNDFIATVSHELKTPLASMRVLVDTLLEGNIKDETQTEEYLRMTARENERLSRMIDNFLTFSRMERNKKAFEIIPANPVAIANDAAEVVRTKYATHKCRFTTDITSKLPEIAADHDAIVTVIVNLLDNACKYTGEHKQVSLKVFAEKDCVSFAVSDNGIGIARRHIRKIFDSFYQVDNSLARKAEGCGLGLSIVKFIVDAHKGKISVDSKLGKGSTFTVRLPIGRNNKNGNGTHN
jgi:signal transduction histidine kinase/tetratricopeptide (TPR) repeat protein